MDHLFQIGDVVQLNSGGPHMTVIIKSGHPGDPYVCEWYESAVGEYKRAEFPEAALTLVG